MAIKDKNGNKKRARVEPEDSEAEANSVPNLKLARVDPADTVFDSTEATHVELEPDDGDVQWPEAKRIREDFLNILDDSDPVIGPEQAIQGLDLVIKSFEEEILIPIRASVPVMTSHSGESRSELGFLLEASDDELGLPPSFSLVKDEQKFEIVDVDEGGGSGAAGLGEMIGYEFPIPSYASLEFGISGGSDANNSYTNSGDFEALEGLFEPPVYISEQTWRPESLSAL